VVERADEVDTLDASPLGVVIVPADKLTLVGVGLLLDVRLGPVATLPFAVNML
jgi:hypothetical protein